MKNSSEEYWEQIELERQKLLTEVYTDIYDEIVKKGVSYFDEKNNVEEICMAYKIYIHFLLNEDYTRCAYLKKIFELFADIRYGKSDNKFKYYLTNKR